MSWMVSTSMMSSILTTQHRFDDHTGNARADGQRRNVPPSQPSRIHDADNDDGENGRQEEHGKALGSHQVQSRPFQPKSYRVIS